MAENFDLIFGQNASQQYAWNDSDYKNGWETIGNIPPTATQFDALQRRADMKAQELNSRLITVEESIAGGAGQKREADTTYAVGDVVTYDGLPMDWVLVCIVDGLSGSADITLPSPRVEGARILDGAVTWAMRKIATYGGIGYRQSSTSYYTGAIAFSTALPTGWYLECTGTGGTTSAGDLIITSPTVGATVTDGTVVWTIRKVADTTDATTTTHGLMSASDKTKLNGIEANANKYTLPTASASVKGGIKVGSGLSMSGETLNNTYSYTLPTASSSVKGGIKIGSGLSMDGETLNNAYSLPAATGSVRGGVTIGSNISLSGDKISLTSGNVTNALGYTPPSTTGANASGSWNINSATATKLATPRTISLTGNVSGSANFDGSKDIQIATSLADVSALAHSLLSKTTAADMRGVIEANAQNCGGIVAESLTSPGYVKFANGLIIEWGNVSVDHAPGADDIDTAYHKWWPYPIKMSVPIGAVATDTTGNVPDPQPLCTWAISDVWGLNVNCRVANRIAFVLAIGIA